MSVAMLEPDILSEPWWIHVSLHFYAKNSLQSDVSMLEGQTPLHLNRPQDNLSIKRVRCLIDQFITWINCTTESLPWKQIKTSKNM